MRICKELLLGLSRWGTLARQGQGMPQRYTIQQISHERFIWGYVVSEWGHEKDRDRERPNQAANLTSLRKVFWIFWSQKPKTGTALGPLPPTTMEEPRMIVQVATPMVLQSLDSE